MPPPTRSGLLQIPTITVNTDEGNSSPASDPTQNTNEHLSPSSALSRDAWFDRPSSQDGSPRSTRRPSSEFTWDAVTLRERSSSFTSSANTAGRSRAGSTATSECFKATYDDVPLSEALTPDPRYKQDFEVHNQKFAFSPGQLNKMLNPKSLAAFFAMSGVEGLSSGLRTDLISGLSVDETELAGRISFEDATHSHDGSSQKKSEVFRKTTDVVPDGSSSESRCIDRTRIFGRNQLPNRKTNGFFKLVWQACQDKIIILLTIAAVVSLALGIYEALSGGSKVDWIEGVAICVAILIVTVVTAANDWQKERQFVKLNKRKDDRDVKVIRSGTPAMISVFDIMVGDVLHIEPGDSPAADGVLISGHGLKCDESSATGESDQMKKTPGQEVYQRLINGTGTKKLDPFIISGSKVLEGVGTYLVTSVGPYSSHGRIMASLQTTSEPTPLQVKLGKLADWIGWLGTGAAGILFSILLIRFLAHLSDNPASPAIKGQQFMDVLIVAITVIVVAIPEGLPLAVTLALAFATTRMVKENNLVRVLRACETMGNATVICSDKTGTLTQNKMTVVAGTWSSDNSFSQLRLDDDQFTPTTTVSEIFKTFSRALKDLIIKSVALNSTAFEDEKSGLKEFVGSKTEVAMLQLAKDHLGMNLREERSGCETVQLFPFDSSRKCMGVVYREPSVGYRLLVKGASELMLKSTTSTVSTTSEKFLVTAPLTSKVREVISGKIDDYAQKSLRTIGLVYQDFPFWPPEGSETLEDDPTAVAFESVFKDMTWIGVVGIQDPLRPEVPGAIKKCNSAGVQVKMVTGDNLTTAAAIATACGIKTDGIVMEGPKFRRLSDTELDEVVPRLQVLARSSPDDKRILVEALKRLGETVAVTGDGTNDGPALKTADVGFSMGIAGTEVAKEASSIILLDDNFKSIVTAIAWGRAVNDAVSKFLQFQITVNITAVALTFVSAVRSNSNQSVLTAVQLLWVNLIMDTFAALALATDGPTDQILDRKPTPKSAPLFTMTMWKMIIGQAIYQLAITLTLYFAGDRILANILTGSNPQLQLDTMIFNTFVWMQIFNEFNNRRLDNNFNIFEGMFKNYWFLGINCVMVGGQVMIIFIGGIAIGVTPLTGVQWAICILCAICCLPWAVLLRTLPDQCFAVIFNFVVGNLTFVLRPGATGFSYVFRMTGKISKSMWAPVKRISGRFHRRGQHNNEANQDEEAGNLSEIPVAIVSPVPGPSPPPITITSAV